MPDQTLPDGVTGRETVDIKPGYEIKDCIISDQRLFRRLSIICQIVIAEKCDIIGCMSIEMFKQSLP